MIRRERKAKIIDLNDTIYRVMNYLNRDEKTLLKHELLNAIGTLDHFEEEEKRRAEQKAVRAFNKHIKTYD